MSHDLRCLLNPYFTATAERRGQTQYIRLDSQSRHKILQLRNRPALLAGAPHPGAGIINKFDPLSPAEEPIEAVGLKPLAGIKVGQSVIKTQ